MKAMVLAAGVGSRLGSLMETLPKALIEVGGKPMLEIVLKRLIYAGVDSAIINVFHKPDLIVDFLKAKNNFGIRIEISRETELLDTGGGLKKAAAFFDDGRPFFLHNVDVLSEIDLGRMLRSHEQSRALATLAAQTRETNRYLLFDSNGFLCGRENRVDAKTEWAAGPVAPVKRLAFGGVHVVSPEIFPKMTESGAFSITKAYLRLAGRGEGIRGFNADAYYWCDIGNPEKLDKARRRADEKGLPL